MGNAYPILVPLHSGCPSLLAEFFFGKDFPIAPIWMIDTCILRPEPGSRMEPRYDESRGGWVTAHCQSGSIRLVTIYLSICIICIIYKKNTIYIYTHYNI